MIPKRIIGNHRFSTAARTGVKSVKPSALLHAGMIDKPMYDQIFRADLVVADISTGNRNANQAPKLEALRRSDFWSSEKTDLVVYIRFVVNRVAVLRTFVGRTQKFSLERFSFTPILLRNPRFEQ
jgi:hypothetical protein